MPPQPNQDPNKPLVGKPVQPPATGNAPSSSGSPAEKLLALKDLPLELHAFGPYRLIRPLGTGGMGAVYLAKHNDMGMLVAIKFLKPDSGSDAARRFEREKKILAQLSGNNHIVGAKDGGVVGQYPYLVMDYVPGTDVEQHVKSEGPLSPAEAVRILQQAVNGVHYAHAKQVIHRDLKPSNLLLAKDGTTKVADFGLARTERKAASPLMSTQMTQEGTIFGTPHYMAPEQASGQAGKASDVYALGCILHFMLTGRAPYQKDGGAIANITAHTTEPIPDLSAIRRLSLQKQLTASSKKAPSTAKLNAVRNDLPPSLVDLSAKLLAKDPQDRPSLPEVDAVLATLEATGFKLPWAQRFQESSPRRKAGILGTFTALAASFVAAASSPWWLASNNNKPVPLPNTPAVVAKADPDPNASTGSNSKTVALPTLKKPNETKAPSTGSAQTVSTSSKAPFDHTKQKHPLDITPIVESTVHPTIWGDGPSRGFSLVGCTWCGAGSTGVP